MLIVGTIDSKFRIEPQLPMSWQAYGNCDLYPKDILIKCPQLAKIVSQSHDSIEPDLEIHFLDYCVETFKVSDFDDETTSLLPYSLHLYRPVYCFHFAF